MAKNNKVFRENRLIKNIEYKNLDKPLSTVYLNLNTKDAFKDMPNPPANTRVKTDTNYSEEDPHRDTIFYFLTYRLTSIIENKFKNY